MGIRLAAWRRVTNKRDPHEPTEPDPHEPDQPEPTEPDYIPDTPPSEPPPPPIRDPRPDTAPPGPLIARFVSASLVLAVLCGAPTQASAQSRDSLLNGAIIGAAIGAGIGVGLNHALRDSDLTVGQYAYGALVYGAIGAGVGLGVDALFSRSPRPQTARPRLLFAPVGAGTASVFGRTRGLTVQWRW